MKHSISKALLIAGITLGYSSYSHSETVVVTGKIDRVLTDTRLYGGCMVWAPTVKPIGDYGLQCRNNYFSFDCNGSTNPVGGKAQAKLNLEQAQLALALDTMVQLTVTDEITINGNCYANRVVLFKPKKDE